MQNDILRLQVPMYNPIAMEFVNWGAYLLHEACSFDLRQRLTALELLEELTAHCYLEDNVDVLLVFEKAIHFDNVWVVQKHLDFYFSYELLNDFLLDEHCFIDHF